MILMTLITTKNVQAQVRIGQDAAPVKGAVLDLKSDSKATGYVGGLKLPSVSITDLAAIPADFNEATAISANASGEKVALEGTVVYNTNLNAPLNIYPGIYYWDKTKWVPLPAVVVAGTDPITVSAPAVSGGTTTYTVSISNGVSEGQVLTWNNTDNKWEAKLPTTPGSGKTFKVSAEITGAYTVTDEDFLRLNISTGLAPTITLPADVPVGTVPVGRTIYMSNKNLGSCNISPQLRNTSRLGVGAQESITVIYLGGGEWDHVTGW